MISNRVTLREVATKAGVHFTTVGLALRGDPRVKPVTASRIVSVAQQLGYEPDPMLSALSHYRHRRQSTFHGTIGYLLPGPPVAVLKQNHGTRLSFEAARAHAQKLGFNVEAFDITQPQMRSERMRQILKARSIQGLVLAPLPEPGKYPLDLWQDFSLVAIGYSIQGTPLHRTCPHQHRSMRLQLRELTALGYRRIGLVISHNANERTEHSFMGAFLSNQLTRPVAERVEPLVLDRFSARSVERWLKEEKVDCIVGERETYDLLHNLGYRFPQTVGFSLLTGRIEDPSISCIIEPWENLGEAAIDMVLALVTNRETGLPKFPRYSLVEGRWNAGSTVRRSDPTRTRTSRTTS